MGFNFVIIGLCLCLMLYASGRLWQLARIMGGWARLVAPAILALAPLLIFIWGLTALPVLWAGLKALASLAASIFRL